MICERCKIAGNLNEQLATLETAWSKREPVQHIKTRMTNLREAVYAGHKNCRGDCMCQHRVGVYVERGYEAEQVSSVVGDGHPDSEDGSPSEGNEGESQPRG